MLAGSYGRDGLNWGGLKAWLDATKPNPHHRDTEDTEKGGLFKTDSLRVLSVSVVSGSPSS